MLPDGNPITLVYRTFRDALLAWEPWAELVKPGNFPDMSQTSFQGFKSQVLPADLPEVALMQGQFALMPNGRNSLASSVDQSFPLVMTFDRMSVLPVNQLKWETLRALVKAKPTLDALSYLRHYEVVQAVDMPFGQAPWARAEIRHVMALQINTQIDVARKFMLIA